MEWLKVSEFTTVITGGTPSTSKKQYWNNGTIPWLNSGELNKNRIYDSKKFITKEGLDNSSAKMMPPDTVLIALTGTTTGVSSILKLTACANQSVTGILPSKKHIPEYLFYYLLFTRKQILKDAYGGAQKHISQAYVKDIKIPLPPLSVQKEIAEKLDKADALRKKDQELLKQYDELAQAIFIDMFGDPVQNEKGWEMKLLNDYITRLVDVGSNGGNDWVSANINMKDEEDYAIMIRTTNFSNNDFENNLKYVNIQTYNLFKKTKVYGGEIIMNKIGSAGDFWIMPNLNRPVSLGLNQLLFEFDGIDTNFFKYYFSTDFGKKLIKSKLRGAITKSITKSAVRELEIYNVPLQIQNQFAEKIQNIEAQKEILKQQAQLSEELFQALLQESFSF